MVLGLYEETPRFTAVWAPPAYKVSAAGPVRYVAVSRNDRVAGYAWVAPGEDAADFLAVADVDESGFDVAVWWVERLREARGDRRRPEDAFEHWMRRASDYGMTVGEVQEAKSLAALGELAGRAGREPAPPAAGTGRNGSPAPVPAPAASGGDAEPDPRQEIARLDRALAAKPVPEDLVAWRNASPDSFRLDWQYLAGTIQQDPAYLAVALTRFDELDEAEVLLHLRVPAGVPAVYLNPHDRRGTLPAPTLLLRRGLLLRVHDVRRRGAQWYVQCVILPPEQAGAERGAEGGAEGGGEGGAERGEDAGPAAGTPEPAK